MDEMMIYSYTKKAIESSIELALEEKKNTFLMGGYPRRYIEAASKAIKNYEVTVVRQSPIGLDFEIQFRDRNEKRKPVFIWPIIGYIKKSLLAIGIEPMTNASHAYH